MPLHELIDIFITLVMLPAIVTIAVRRWRQGFTSYYLVPNWIILAYALLAAAALAAQAAAGEPLSNWQLTVAFCVAVILAGMVWDRTTAVRFAFYCWRRGCRWRDSIEIGRQFAADVEAALDRKKKRDADTEDQQ